MSDPVRVVIARRGFWLSHEAVMRYASQKGIELCFVIDKVAREYYGDDVSPNDPGIFVDYFIGDDSFFFEDIDRTDPVLLAIVSEMGDAASRDGSSLAIVEIPPGVEWHIARGELDNEWVAENHRVWTGQW